MTPQELTDRAKRYVGQALEMLNAVEARSAVADAAAGDWVSLRRNLESAHSDLETLAKGA